MEDFTGSPKDRKRPLRDWIDPLHLYDPRRPAGRLVFFWGLAIFPLLVIFLLLTSILIFVETVFPTINPDYIGIIVYPFMLGWVAAAVAITRRRLLQLNMSPMWVWLVIFPIVSLPLLIYLLVKTAPLDS